MSRTDVRLYWDGEFYVDGSCSGRIYDDGQIYLDGKPFGKLYRDGDIYVENRKVGKAYPDGDLWFGNRKAASDVPLLQLLDYLSSGSSDSSRCTNIYLDSDALAELKYASGSASGGWSGFRPRTSSGGPGVFFFVVALLLICMLIACFQFWWKEVPRMFTDSMNTPWVGTVATISVYVWLVILLVLHWDMGTRSNKVSFFKGLLMHGGSVVAHVIVFFAVDMIATALTYGLSPFAGLGELGSVTGFGGLSGLLGIVLAAAVCGLAPAIVGSLATMLYLKVKGPRRTRRSWASSASPTPSPTASGASADLPPGPPPAGRPEAPAPTAP